MLTRGSAPGVDLLDDKKNLEVKYSFLNKGNYYTIKGIHRYCKSIWDSVGDNNSSTRYADYP